MRLQARLPEDVLAFRFGYGLPLPEGAPQTLAEALNLLTGPDRAATRRPVPGLEEVRPFVEAAMVARSGSRQGTVTPAALKEAQAAQESFTLIAQRAQMLRALESPDGLRERLVAFWADHFTTRSKAATDSFLPFDLIETAIRPHLNGPFATMLTAVTLHPAMLAYLDQSSSYGPTSARGKKTGRGLNENLARELIELHTLGVGAGYSQTDVRQMAELLTGLGYKPRRGMYFAPGQAEPGAETVLGKSYDGEGVEPIRAALADLAARPETTAHLARKLVVHFLADVPDPGVVAAVEAALAGGTLGDAYAALLTQDAAWTPEAAKVRRPVEYVTAGLRALGIGGDELAAMQDGPYRRNVFVPMTAMGQPMARAPGPDGWPEAAEDWITPQALAARITWSMETPQRLVKPLPDAVDLARRALGPRASERLIWALTRAETQRDAVGLVFASPEFNRR